MEQIQSKFTTLFKKFQPTRGANEIKLLESDLQHHLQNLVVVISDLQTAAETEINKWRSLYKK